MDELGQLKAILAFLLKLGISPDVLVLAVIGLVIAFLLFKYLRAFIRYNRSVENIVRHVDTLTTELHSRAKELDARCDICSDRHNSVHHEYDVQLNKFNEKLDNIEDHMKDIKKQLLFR